MSMDLGDDLPPPTEEETRREWEQMLDQPTKGSIDPYHPHMAVKPSVDVIPDYERLIANLTALVQHATGEQKLSPSQADRIAGESSQLMRRIANAASNKGEDK